MTSVLLAGVLAVGAVLAPPLRAATFAVDATDDRGDASPGDGTCDAGGACTLRAAVQETNALAGPDEIVLPAGTYRLTLRGEDDSAAAGDLDVTDALTVTGAGAATTIVDARKAKDRAFDVTGSGALVLGGVTVQKGKAPKGSTGGGGIRNQGTLAVTDSVVTRCKSSDDGGGIDHQAGTLELTNVTLTKNKAKDDGGAIDLDGGTAALVGVTLTRNRAKGEGGALENSGTFVTLTNVVATGNKAKKAGGAFTNEDGGTMLLEGCTITGNKAKVGAGIDASDVDFGPNTTTLTNTTLGSNKKQNCAGVVTDGGGNSDSDGSCGF